MIRNVSVFNLRWVVAIAIDPRGEDTPTTNENCSDSPLLVGRLFADVNG